MGSGSGDGTYQLGAPGTHQAGNAENFALADREINIAERIGGRREPANLKRNMVRRGWKSGEHTLQRAPDHRLDNGADRDIAGVELLHFRAVGA